VIREVRADLLQVARRAAELRIAAAQVDDVVQNAEAVDDSLTLLASFASRTDVQSEGNVVSTRAAISVRRGRAAIETLRKDTAALKERIEEVVRGLEATATHAPEWPSELDAAVPGALQDGAQSLVRLAESLIEGLRSLERASKEMRGGADQVLGGVERSQEDAPKLIESLTELDLGSLVEDDLVGRLERARAEYQAPGGGHLTASARSLIDEVVTSAEEARLRLVRLIAATEGTLDVLRAR
jgi:hypothetical protein